MARVFNNHEIENQGWKRPIVRVGHLTVDGVQYCHSYKEEVGEVSTGNGVGGAAPHGQKKFQLTKWLRPKKIISIFRASLKALENVPPPVPRFRMGMNF